jgi:UDP:flavonoid glycosyltransferase YjiC (YdhE family)
MTQVLFLSDPSQADVNPILGMANELITRGEKVTFFSSDEFKAPIEQIGADFKAYNQELNIFQGKKAIDEEEKPKSGLISALLEPMKFIDDILVQIRGLKFDYAVFSPSYPYANIITQLLGIPKKEQATYN